MWKITIKIVVIGGVALMVAPEQMSLAIKELSKGIGLIASGLSEMAWEHTTDSVEHFVQEGFMHPTQGAVGWKVIDWVKGWFQ